MEPAAGRCVCHFVYHFVCHFVYHFGVCHCVLVRGVPVALVPVPESVYHRAVYHLVCRWHAVAQIAAELGVKRTTVYGYLS